MRHKRLKMIAVLLFGLGISGLQAQGTILASGGDAAGTGGSASYSIGQVAYKTFSGTNGSVAYGNQQPFEISVLTGIDAPGISLRATVYPNPTTNFLKLEIENFDYTSLTLHLCDINGKLFEYRKPDGNTTNIDMGNLPSGVYFLTLKQKGKEIKTFKIIKK